MLLIEYMAKCSSVMSIDEFWKLLAW